MREHELRAAREHAALRDQFAAAALTGLLLNNGAITILNGVTVLDVAYVAYLCADAMLARRAQPTADAPAPFHEPTSA